MTINLPHLWWDEDYIYKWTSAELTAQVIASKQARSDLKDILDPAILVECGAIEVNATKLLRN
jgi:hypothetical protein